MPTIVKTILARLEEPSTWAGGGIAATLAHQYFGATGDAVIGVAAAGAALLAIVLPEKSA